MRTHARSPRTNSFRRPRQRDDRLTDLGAMHPAHLAVALRAADAGSRQRALDDLQSRVGNAGVATIVGARDSRGPHRRSSIGAAIAFLDSLGLGSSPDPLDTSDESTGLEGDTAEAPVPAQSGTTIQIADSPFTVSGTFVQVAEQIAARTEAGSVTSQVSDIYLEPIGTKPVRLAAITVTETRSLPNWADRPKATDKEQAEWDRFRGAVAAHEQRHIDIDVATFTGIHRQCIGVPSAKADAVIDAAIEAADTANAEFDTKTDHGRRTGTVINTAITRETEKVP